MKFCQGMVAMCVCVCVCVYKGVTDLQPESNGLSLSLVFIPRAHTHRERKSSSSCDSFNRPGLYGPREGHPWVKGQTNFLSDLQAKQGWWQCSKNVQHKFSSANQPCSLQRRTEPAQRVLAPFVSLMALTIMRLQTKYDMDYCRMYGLL